ncbi:MAG TPA: hypothetical protein VM143_02345 [Acidimicrobiales bacterium]|nr:hypothetical protein [Acidimicrobiales bacterium]
MILLPTMLSQALVGWTIEVDNAFELRMTHRTAAMRKRGEVLQGPWLVSFALYVHCIRHLTPQGVTLSELEGRARVLGPVSGLERWGYVTISRIPRQRERRVDPNLAVVRPTAAGLQAQSVWARLPDEVDARWKDRYGDLTVSRLREALIAVVARLDTESPDYLPGVRGNANLLHLLPGDERLPTRWRTPRPVRSEPPTNPTSLPLYALVSKVLVAFALEYERDAALSLALGANLIRVLDDLGVPVSELPRLVGASKEAIAHSLTVSKRIDIVIVDKAPGKRTSEARLTPRGRVAQQRHHDLVNDIERRWATRFGGEVVQSLRSSLEEIVVASDLADSPLAEAYGPLPGTWRAEVPTPETLPHFPMLVRGGGYPDGA